MKKYLLIAMIVAMTATTCWSANLTSHVTLAPNGKGDLLIFPVYVALPGGWNTNLTVINTDRTRSVVAKLVVRSGKLSQELLDFLIYLSPADVWTGKLTVANNIVYMHSEDDSCLSAVNTWASAASPLHQPLNVKCPAEDTSAYGYVEVYEAWTSAVVAMDTSVAKSTIKTAYDTAAAFTTLNILAGNFEIVNSAAGIGTLEQATVFADFDIDTRLGVGAETSLADSPNNNICEIEAVLSKDSVAIPYYNNGSMLSIDFMTFPTKKTLLPATGCTIAGVTGPFFAQNTAVPGDVNHKKYNVKYTMKYWDLTEKSPSASSPIFSPAPPAGVYQFPDEVNLVGSSGLDQSGTYKQGWINYTFPAEVDNFDADGIMETECPPVSAVDMIHFWGAPVIPMVLFAGVDGMSMMYGAHSLGTVDYRIGAAGAYTTIPEFQYSDR